MQGILTGVDLPPRHRATTCEACQLRTSRGTVLVPTTQGVQTGNDEGQCGRQRINIFSAAGDLRYGSRMKLTDEKIGGINLIRSYGAGEVRVGETVIQGSCLITVDQIIRDWRPQTVADLSLDDLQPVIAMKPEVIVIGSGPRQEFPAHEVLGAVLSRGIGCEVMNTGAACRTYNILASEGRTVVAALLLGTSS
jgi:uncharacterized protein